LGGKLLGWRTVCAVELDAYCRRVLLARQRDGFLPPFPIWDDVRTFDGRPWRGAVDVISGGFPCVDISAAGKGAGIEGQSSGLWSEMARIIGEVRPGRVFVENGPMLTSRGLGRVLRDLAELGFDASWGVLGASDVGAPHVRKRIWIVAAHPDRDTLRDEEQRGPGRRHDLPDRGSAEPRHDGAAEPLADADGGRREVEREPDRQSGDEGAPGRELDRCDRAACLADADRSGLDEQRGAVAERPQHAAAQRGSWWAVEPDVGRVAHGVAARVDRLRALGNGQVPGVARRAWEALIVR
jgi:DNA (cytosine-5)-methyltransferase 1